MSIRIQENILLAPLTTFKIGGNARYFTEARTEEEIHEAIAWAHEHNIPFIIFGGGSNVLVPDEGLNALVVHVATTDVSFDANKLIADAGCNLLALIRSASSKGLGGWEKLSGIPGTLGGAIRGNAGAFGTEIKDVAMKVRAFNTDTTEVRKFGNSECAFSYRHSFFKDNPAWLILRAHLGLKPVDSRESARLIEETIAERERRHLQNVQAAGSFFMNPVAPVSVQELFEKEKGMKAREGRVPAGWLIEKVGMKGAVLGGATASEQHPNYIVNMGNATAVDVRALAENIKHAVMSQFTILLEEEAVDLGVTMH